MERRINGEPLEVRDVRTRAYQELREVLKSTMADYYRRYPLRASDTRSQEDQDAALALLRATFTVLNQYDLTERRRP